MTRFVALALAAATAACGSSPSSSPAGPSPSTPAITFSTHQSAHFTFRYTAIDAATVAQTASLVEAEYARILEDLGIMQMPTVTVTLYPNIDALRQAVSPIVGSIPSFATGLITGAEAVHILSPSLPTTWSYSDGVTSTVHEFAHCASLRLNPSLANNPRWLWESVALFEALQYDSGRTFPLVTGGTLPTFAQLNDLNNTTVYNVGAWLGHFVAETRGWDTYRELIRANGDVGRVLGMTETAFLNDWAAFVRTFVR